VRRLFLVAARAFPRAFRIQFGDELADQAVRDCVEARQRGAVSGIRAAAASFVELITAGLVPKDLEGAETTGYRFQVTRATDGKSWYATAEPAQYGRSGRLSFYLDASGVRSGDAAGKPLVVKN